MLSMFIHIPYFISIPILLITALVIFVALRPSVFRIARSTVISAPPAVVFGLVNDFHNWAQWSPWEKLDPGMKKTFEGPPAGAGSIYSWVGNKKIGEGRMTLTESRADEMVRITLQFMRPFKATNTTEFSFVPQGDQTAVTWTMTGNNNFMAKAVCLAMNMDKTVGGEFEKGLAQIKAIAESGR